MTDITTIVQRTFEDIRMTDETGFEFWSARTLMKALGYSANGESSLESARRQKSLAKIACKYQQTIFSPPTKWSPYDLEISTISVKWLKQKRWIPENRALADFDTEVELRAKDFIYAMTDHNIRKNDIQWKEALEEELISSSHATRTALLGRGIMPENLIPQEDLKHIGKRKRGEIS